MHSHGFMFTTHVFPSDIDVNLLLGTCDWQRGTAERLTLLHDDYFKLSSAPCSSDPLGLLLPLSTLVDHGFTGVGI